MPVLSPQEQVERAFRKKQVLEMVVAGMSIRDIARHMGVANSTVCTYKRESLDELREDRASLADQFFTIILERCEVQYRRMNAIATDPKATNGEKIMASQQALNALKRESEILGIDAPKKLKIETSYVDDAAKEIARLALQFIPEEVQNVFLEKLMERLAEISADDDVIDATATVTHKAIEDGSEYDQGNVGGEQSQPAATNGAQGQPPHAPDRNGNGASGHH